MNVKHETAGPFSSVFSSPEARVLDQAFMVGNMKQTIPMLEESTGLSFKTVQKAPPETLWKGVRGSCREDWERPGLPVQGRR